MSNFIAGWHLIYTRPRHERKVFNRLNELGVECFLPTRKILRTWHDRKKYIDDPLFPSYVFVHLRNSQDYYDGMDTDGYLYYVRSGKKVAKVHESVVNNIKLVVSPGNELEVTYDHYQPGKRLVICQGALTGLNCELVRVNSRQKLLVRVDLLQRNILMTIPAESLMAI